MKLIECEVTKQFLHAADGINIKLLEIGETVFLSNANANQLIARELVTTWVEDESSKVPEIPEVPAVPEVPEVPEITETPKEAKAPKKSGKSSKGK